MAADVTPPDPATDYAIISQEHTEELLPTGSFQDTWTISYQTPSGTIGRLRIPAAQYHPETIDQMIRQQVRMIEAVHQLGATPPAGS